MARARHGTVCRYVVDDFAPGAVHRRRDPTPESRTRVGSSPAAFDPSGPVERGQLAHLQRTAGNRAVTQLLAVQRKRPMIQVRAHDTGEGIPKLCDEYVALASPDAYKVVADLRGNFDSLWGKSGTVTSIGQMRLDRQNPAQGFANLQVQVNGVQPKKEKGTTIATVLVSTALRTITASSEQAYVVNQVTKAFGGSLDSGTKWRVQ